MAMDIELDLTLWEGLSSVPPQHWRFPGHERVPPQQGCFVAVVPLRAIREPRCARVHWPVLHVMRRASRARACFAGDMLPAQACVTGSCRRSTGAFSRLHTAGELRLTLQETPVSCEVHHLSMNVHRTFNMPYHTIVRYTIPHRIVSLPSSIRIKFTEKSQ